MQTGQMDFSRCLHTKNGLGMTIGDFLGMSVGEEYTFPKTARNVRRVKWTKWCIDGGKLVGLFEAFSGAGDLKK